MSVELEHHIGQSTSPQCLAIHPSNQLYLYSSGANLITASLTSTTKQRLLPPIHDAPISCLALSPSGRFGVSAQEGEFSNVYVWDFNREQVLYSLEEHDNKVQALGFSHDEKLLATLGGEGDGKLIIWDLSNGMIVSSSGKVPPETICLALGGFVRDVKRRETHKYQMCTGGRNGVVLWELDPFTGVLEAFPAIAEARGTTSRYISAVAYSLDGEKVIALTTTGDFLIVSLRTRRIVGAVAVAKAALESIAIYHGGMIIGCADRSLQIFDRNCEFKRSIRLPSPAVALSVTLESPEVIAVTSNGSTLRINMDNLQVIVLAESHSNSVVAVAFSEASNDRFATASSDGTVR